MREFERVQTDGNKERQSQSETTSVCPESMDRFSDPKHGKVTNVISELTVPPRTSENFEQRGLCLHRFGRGLALWADSIDDCRQLTR